MLRLALLLTLISAVSCATKSQEVKTSSESIGVVSLFEDQLPLVVTGKTAKKPFPAASLPLNEMLLQEYSAQLAGMNHQAIQVSLSSPKVEALKSDARALKDIYLGDRWQILTQYVLDESAKQGAK